MQSVLDSVKGAGFGHLSAQEVLFPYFNDHIMTCNITWRELKLWKSRLVDQN